MSCLTRQREKARQRAGRFGAKGRGGDGGVSAADTEGKVWEAALDSTKNDAELSI